MSQHPRTGVADGVFFTPSTSSLPRGRHDLSRDEVLRRQRERAMIAATELLAAGGYRDLRVGAICTRASLSRAAFYECYDDKDACLFAAYDRFIAILLERLALAGDEDTPWDDYVTAIIRIYLETLRSDLVVARAFQVEMDAVGEAARHRRREALELIAGFLRERHAAWLGREPSQSPTSYLGGVYAVRQLAADALESADPSSVGGLLDDLAQWVRRAFAETAPDGA